MSATPKKPDMESKYFSSIEFEKIRQLSLKKREVMAVDELKRRKDTHWKKCSNCGWDLEEIKFNGVNIWKCFSCNGVFTNEKEFETLCEKESGIIKSLLSIFKS